MSKTWFVLQVRCPSCGKLNVMRVWKDVPPLCSGCGKQMNVVKET